MSEESWHSQDPKMAETVKKFLPDDELDVIFEGIAEGVYRQVINAKAFPSTLYVVLDNSGVAAELMERANADMKKIGLDGTAKRLMCAFEFQPGDGCHQRLYDLGKSFDGAPVAVILASETWVSYRTQEEMDTKPYVQPRYDPKKLEAMMISVLTFDQRKRSQMRVITRTEANKIKLGEVSRMDQADMYLPLRFYQGYYARIVEKHKMDIPVPPRPPIHADN